MGVSTSNSKVNAPAHGSWAQDQAGKLRTQAQNHLGLNREERGLSPPSTDPRAVQSTELCSAQEVEAHDQDFQRLTRAFRHQPAPRVTHLSHIHSRVWLPLVPCASRRPSRSPVSVGIGPRAAGRQKDLGVSPAQLHTCARRELTGASLSASGPGHGKGPTPAPHEHRPQASH